jgi:hypothetical protein
VDLIRAMHDAAGTAPPTTVDLDGIVAGERRRSNRLRMIGAVGLVAVVTLGVPLLPRYFGESQAPPSVAAPSTIDPTPGGGPTRSPGPCVTPKPTTGTSRVVGGATPRAAVTEPCRDAVPRLEAALTTVLGRELPGLELRDARDDRPVPPAKVERDFSLQAAYGAGFVTGPQRAVLGVILEASGQPLESAIEGLDCHPGEKDCTRTQYDGVTVILRGDDAQGYQVNAYRGDGTVVVVIGRPQEGGNGISGIPFTKDQLARIATAPELTLYP